MMPIEKFIKNILDPQARPAFDAEERAILVRALKAIDSARSIDDAIERAALWQRCYSAAKESVPPFLRKPEGEPYRLNGRYLISSRQDLEAEVLKHVRGWLFQEFFKPLRTVVEFGCGTGHNLLHLGQQQPWQQLVGCDWSPAAVGMVNLLRRSHKINIQGRLFDFFDPWSNAFNLPSEAGVLTIGALEQVGDRWGPFLSYLLMRRPACVVHLEPVAELYRDDDLLDQLALRYHHARGYLRGYLPELRALERGRRIELLRVEPLRFGSWLHEAYTIIAWRPRPSASNDEQ